MNLTLNNSLEWLEPDGLGGFASGAATGLRTRRYHALLLVATTPPTGRFVLVNGLEAWVETPSGRYALSSHLYEPGVEYPDGVHRIETFLPDPWPHWVYRLEDGTRIRQELFVPRGFGAAVLAWRLLGKQEGVKLSVRFLLSGRDYHHLHHENSVFRFEPELRQGHVLWRPYPDVPGVVALASGMYQHDPCWYRQFHYAEEMARGLDHTEDLASPGVFHWNLSEGEGFCVLAAQGFEKALFPTGVSAEACVQGLRDAERRRRERFVSNLERAADAYIASRGDGKTIIAGYPWFTDWGRDTFISLRGLCLATGRLDVARDILVEWAGAVSDGMLPNRFTDRGETPEYNSVDASLWYIVAIHEYLAAMRAARREIEPTDEQTLMGAVEAILSGYARGTRYGIRLDDDGLLSAGAFGVALTWMDAKVGDWVVTPRVGKPVEVQALWLNALALAGTHTPRWADLFSRGLKSFRSRFWNEPSGYLFDVVDPGHHPGTADGTFRPNQVFAVGGLPLTLLEPGPARKVVDAVEKLLWTPLGLRTLAPSSPGYQPRCLGEPILRDGAYHQGTAWPWLLGPFVEAWLRVRGNAPEAKREARSRFLKPLLEHLDEAGLGHISEIVDGDPPHTPRGCPFQAWSLAELLRLDRVVLADDGAPRAVSSNGESEHR